ncbi:MAG: gas vesicle protein GvpG [Deltaproteobacteria bacterium]|nr:gas vesicle protein GvpG [Deltaproteobacteria bacterium]
MGFLLDDILLLPVKGVAWVADNVKSAAEAELCDESKVQGSLLTLQMRLETDEISEAQYMEQETILLKRIEDMRRYKEREGCHGNRYDGVDR